MRSIVKKNNRKNKPIAVKTSGNVNIELQYYYKNLQSVRRLSEYVVGVIYSELGVFAFVTCNINQPKCFILFIWGLGYLVYP